MAKPKMEKYRKVVNKEHHKWIPTSEIAAKLAETHPRLEFRWLEKEHIHGVDSIVHGVCETHSRVVPMHVGNLWRGTTKYGCPACAYELGYECEGSDTFHVKRNHPNYEGISKVEFNLFLAIKDVFPDALSGHKMKGRKEIDIWIPSLRCGCEYNGVIYHSSAYKKTEEYHIEKSRQANRENKQIFHLFPDEALDVERVIRMFRSVQAGRNPLGTPFHIKPKTQLSLSIVVGPTADAFHEKWNPISIRDSLIHTNFGLFNQGELVVLFGVNLKERIILKASYAKVFDEIDKVLLMLAKMYGGVFSIAADVRNPLEVGLCESALLNKRLAFVGASRPLAIPLDKSFTIPKMSFTRMSDSEGPWYANKKEHVALTWDCGMLIYCRKQDRHMLPQ